jgi:hypothetical protein
MTKLMEKAIEKLRAVPEPEQDAVAGFVLNQLEEDRRWDETSIKHADQLKELADEALEDFRAGRTTALDPERL